MSKDLVCGISGQEIYKINSNYNLNASAGNRTRAARVAGEQSTTEPPLLVDTLAQRLECSPMARETWVQSQVESYQRL